MYHDLTTNDKLTITQYIDVSLIENLAYASTTSSYQGVLKQLDINKL